jgi:hypothetical protein
MVNGEWGICFGFALAVLATPLAAQAPRSFEPIDSGKVIRFQAGGITMRGRLLAPLRATSDSVAYCRFPGPPCVPPTEQWQVGHVRPATLEHLEVQVGNKAMKGARIGGVIGAVFSFVGVAVTQGFCDGDCASDMELVFAAVVNTAAWASIGALIGSGSPKLERRF